MQGGASVLGYMLLSACGGGGGASNSVSIVPAGSSSPLPTPTPTPSPPPTPTPLASSTKTQFGVNYYDLFHRFITYAAPFDPETQLRPLADRGLRVVRFAACPLWARDWKLWFANPERYIAALDRIFDAADKLGMKMVPVLVSAPFGLSDYYGEPFSAWGNTTSATRRAFDVFVPQMVQRYKSRASLLMWELANEMNAWADRSDGFKYYPPVDTSLNTVRTVADNYSIQDFAAVNKRFAELVRTQDSQHPVESGSTTPRNSQITNGKGLTGYDSRADMMTAMSQTLAGGNELLSIHLYDDLLDRFSPLGSTFPEILSMAKSCANSYGIKLFLGEFGVRLGVNPDADRIQFREILQSIKNANVDFAAAWAYDYLYSDWNITTTNGRSWMLDEMVAAQAN